MIKTDGVGCSIIMHRSDQDPVQLRKKLKKLGDAPIETFEEVYVDDVTNYREGIKVVGIDPGKDDILHCTDGYRFYRYTQNQRRKQSKSTKIRHDR